MAQDATAEAFKLILSAQGRDYLFEGVQKRGLPSGIQRIQDNDLETGEVYVEAIRVLRSDWDAVDFKIGKSITDVDLNLDRRIADVADDKTSETYLLYVSVD